MIFTIVVIAFIAAQFHPKGKAFLASDAGAAATVALSAVAILSMLPGVLTGQILSLLLIGVWAWVAYPRLAQAKAWFVRKFNRP